MRAAVDITVLLVSIACLALPGWLLLQSLFRATTSARNLITAWLLGAGVTTVFILLLGLAGVGYNRFTFGALWLAETALAVGWLLTRQRVGIGRIAATSVDLPRPTVTTQSRCITWIAIGFDFLSAGLLVLATVAALSASMDSIPGLCVWGIKGKILFETGGWPWSFYTDDAWQGAHRDYPPGVPLLLNWIYIWRGDACDHAAKLIPPLALAGVWWLVRDTLKRGGCSRVVSAAFSLAWLANPSLLAASAVFYIEPLMLLTLICGWSWLLSADSSAGPIKSAMGMILVAGAIWIKSEGVIICGLTLVIWFLYSRRTITPRSQWIIVVSCAATAFVLLVPWRVFCASLDLRPQDFVSPTRVESWSLAVSQAKNMWDAMIALGRIGWVDCKQGGVALWLPVLGLLAKPAARSLDRTAWLPSLAITWLMCCAAIFVFSDVELSWHFNSLPRLILPAGLLLTLWSGLQFVKQNYIHNDTN